ncbi:MAG: hypothetical protein NTV97_01505 [Alphaproteobacteria bacterium]|nr:hypothetical protein [Alphaproteobacteria bacterium]
MRALAAVAIAAILLAAVALPLATFTIVLALFGPAHIASELRYLDHRFSARLGPSRVKTLVLLLAAAVVTRLLGTLGVLPPAPMAALEIALAGAAVLMLVPSGGPLRWSAAALALVLVAGAVMAPLLTLLILAVTHNLTPLGFLAERLRGRERRRALVLGCIGFIAIPLVVASGLPFALLSNLGWIAPQAAVFPSAGSLESNLGAYVPRWALDEGWALHAFSACVFAQCMHYVAVIGVLPALIPAGSAPILPWPTTRRFVVMLIVLAGAMALGFSFDYEVARHVYALAALLHAWLELPLLLLALEPIYKPAE